MTLELSIRSRYHNVVIYTSMLQPVHKAHQKTSQLLYITLCGYVSAQTRYASFVNKLTVYCACCVPPVKCMPEVATKI